MPVFVSALPHHSARLQLPALEREHRAQILLALLRRVRAHLLLRRPLRQDLQQAARRQAAARPLLPALRCRSRAGLSSPGIHLGYPFSIPSTTACAIGWYRCFISANQLFASAFVSGLAASAPYIGRRNFIRPHS